MSHSLTKKRSENKKNRHAHTQSSIWYTRETGTILEPDWFFLAQVLFVLLWNCSSSNNNNNNK